MNELENMSCGSRNLFLYQSVQSLPGFLDVLDSEKILYKFDCVALSRVTRQREKDSHDRRLLSFRVTQASVEINATIKLTSILSIAGVRDSSVYTLRRSTKCSIDSNKLASTSQLDITPLAASFTWMSERYLHMD